MSKKTTSKKKKIEIRQEFSNVKHWFTSDERLTITETLTKGLRNISELEENKKAIVADFTARIKGAKASVEEAANKLDAGYDFRSMKCDIEYDYPNRIKRFYPLRENGKRGGQVKEEVMLESDLQAHLPLKIEPKAPDAKAAAATDAKPKRPRKAKVAPGQPLVSVGVAVEDAEPASHKITPVRGEKVEDEQPPF